MTDDDDLFFADDDDEQEVASNCWKILIVDDDEDIHTGTKFALSSANINGRCVEFIDAYSGKEGEDVIVKDRSIDLVLLDVVMESPTAGIQLAQRIRGQLNMREVPVIVIRSGQMGDDSEIEREVRRNQDIQAVLKKSEVTREKLVNTLSEFLKD